MANTDFRVKAQWIGLNDMDDALAKMQHQFDKQALQQIANAGAEVMVKTAKQNVPRRTLFGQRSIQAVEGAGTLADSGLKMDEATTRVGWDKDAFYLYFHEFGTRYMSARPFFRPAFDGTVAEAIRKMHAAARIRLLRS